MAKNKVEKVAPVADAESVENESVVAVADAESVLENGLVKIKRIAEGVYHGFDGKDPVANALTMAQNEEIFVTSKKAEQLMTDFPSDWELI